MKRFLSSLVAFAISSSLLADSQLILFKNGVPELGIQEGVGLLIGSDKSVRSFYLKKEAGMLEKLKQQLEFTIRELKKSAHSPKEPLQAIHPAPKPGISNGAIRTLPGIVESFKKDIGPKSQIQVVEDSKTYNLNPDELRALHALRAR